MRNSFLASWAEPVPGAQFPITVDKLLELPDSPLRYEIVEGRLVSMAGSGSEATAIAMNLVFFLQAFVKPRRLGRVSGPDGQYNLTLPGASLETALAPDVGFVQSGRLPPMGTPESRKIPHIAPDLVAEVASPNQYRPEMEAKIAIYLTAGVRLVWLIWPTARQVDVWRPGDATPTTLAETDDLDGLDVLPGFRCRIADLFSE